VKAEELLSRPGLRSGTFLVRKSSSCPGSFALSVLNQGKVFHYLIIGDSSGGGAIRQCLNVDRDRRPTAAQLVDLLHAMQ
jgi:hypothetical protein